MRNNMLYYAALQGPGAAYPLPQSSQTKPFTRPNSLAFAVTSVSLRHNACPAISRSYVPIDLPVCSKVFRISPAHRASSSPNSNTRTGPARNIFKRSVFASVLTLFATPYQSSYKDTDGTHTGSPGSTAFENRFRTGSDVRLINAMHALVSSKYFIPILSVKDLAAWRRRLLPAFLQQGVTAEPVHRGKPLRRVRNQRFQKDALRHPSHPHRIPLESKLLRQPHRLAASVPKQLRDSTLAHKRPPLMIYTMNLYQVAREPISPWPDAAAFLFFSLNFQLLQTKKEGANLAPSS